MLLVTAYQCHIIYPPAVLLYMLFRVGGLVQAMAWDQHDERLAVLCQG